MHIPGLAIASLLILFTLACEKKEKFNGTLYDKPAAEFCLTGWQGGKEKRICLSDFRDRIVMIFFGYTHCPDVCPAALQVLARTLELLGEKNSGKIQVLFISVDPERDKPETAQRYAEYFHPSFIGLTGTQDEIKKVAKDYMVYYGKVEGQSKGGYLVDHTALIYLIDQKGNLKLIYPTTRQKPELIAEDIRKLL